MTGPDFTAAMDALGMTASQMAVALGMSGDRDSSGPRNVRRWRRAGLPRGAAGQALAEKIQRMIEQQRKEQ